MAGGLGVSNLQSETPSPPLTLAHGPWSSETTPWSSETTPDPPTQLHTSLRPPHQRAARPVRAHPPTDEEIGRAFWALITARPGRKTAPPRLLFVSFSSRVSSGPAASPHAVLLPRRGSSLKLSPDFSGAPRQRADGRQLISADESQNILSRPSSGGDQGETQTQTQIRAQIQTQVHTHT